MAFAGYWQSCPQLPAAPLAAPVPTSVLGRHVEACEKTCQAAFLFLQQEEQRDVEGKHSPFRWRNTRKFLRQSMKDGEVGFCDGPSKFGFLVCFVLRPSREENRWQLIVFLYFSSLHTSPLIQRLLLRALPQSCNGVGRPSSLLSHDSVTPQSHDVMWHDAVTWHCLVTKCHNIMGSRNAT